MSMKLYHNEQDRADDAVYQTVHVARQNGFDTAQREDDDHVLCGKHGSSELIDVYPDGSWIYKNSDVDSDMPPTGTSAIMLGIYFANPELYADGMAN